jgi:hypothetical protein
MRVTARGVVVHLSEDNDAEWEERVFRTRLVLFHEQNQTDINYIWSLLVREVAP